MTNSHEGRHKTVTQTEKDRTITGTAAVTQIAKDRTITGIVTGTLISKKGDTDYIPIIRFGKYSDAQTDKVLWSPAGGKKFVVTDIIISCNEACNVVLMDDDVHMFELYFDAKGGCVMNLQTPWKSTTADNDLKVITTEAVLHTITVLGYEV